MASLHLHYNVSVCASRALGKSNRNNRIYHGLGIGKTAEIKSLKSKLLSTTPKSSLVTDIMLAFALTEKTNTISNNVELIIFTSSTPFIIVQGVISD